MTVHLSGSPTLILRASGNTVAPEDAQRLSGVQGGRLNVGPAALDARLRGRDGGVFLLRFPESGNRGGIPVSLRVLRAFFAPFAVNLSYIRISRLISGDRRIKSGGDSLIFR